MTCPHHACTGEVDVPPGTFDGAELKCWSCRQPCYMVVSEDGSWWLDAGDEED